MLDLAHRTVICEGEEFVMKLVVRKWVEISPELEFRAFVHKGQLNGITQYYKACFSPTIASQKAQMEKDMVKFWQNNLKDKIKVESYVIDFAWTPNKVYLIELNHWGHTVRSSTKAMTVVL